MNTRKNKKSMNKKTRKQKKIDKLRKKHRIEKVRKKQIDLDIINNYLKETTYDTIAKKISKEDEDTLKYFDLFNDLGIRTLKGKVQNFYSSIMSGIFTSLYADNNQKLCNPESEILSKIEIFEILSKYSLKIPTDFFVFRNEYSSPSYSLENVKKKDRIPYIAPFSTSYCFDFPYKNWVNGDIFHMIHIPKNMDVKYITLLDNSQFEITLQSGYLEIQKIYKYKNKLFLESKFIPMTYDNVAEHLKKICYSNKQNSNKSISELNSYFSL